MTGHSKDHRDRRLDAARGIAIVTVVIGHAARGMLAAGLVGSESLTWAVSERWIYFVHLPLFAFVTGMLMPRSVEKYGWLTYLKRREWAFLWPLAVWSLIMGAASTATNSLKNSATTWAEVFQLWRPIGHLWYLPFLMVATLVLVVLAPWRSAIRFWVSAVLLTAFSLLFWGNTSLPVFGDGPALLLFFGMGAALGPERLVASWRRLPRWSLMAFSASALGTTALLGLLTSASLPTTAPSNGWSLPNTLLGVLASCAGIIGLLSCAGALSPKPARILGFLGRHSMTIYLAHILATAGTRIVLMRLAISNEWIHLFLGSTMGVMAPLLLIPVLRHVPWLVEAPGLARPATPRRGGGELSQSEAHQTARRADG